MTSRAPRGPRFAVTSVECFERPVTLRLPFHFGAAIVGEAPQAFVGATIRGTDGRGAAGMAAELMIPKWFDKSLERSNADNIDDLRAALGLAAAAYWADSAPRTAFGHAAFHYRALLDAGASVRLNELTVSYGAALADRAILDALCRMRDVSFGTALWLNLPGLDATLAPDLAHFDIDALLSTLSLPAHLDVRHTIGMADPLTGDDPGPAQAPNDGLPVTLTDVIARYRNRYFKIKLGGDVAADLERLRRIASVLEPLADYRITLDGNEQFSEADSVSELQRALRADARLARLRGAILCLEQPLPRAIALETDVRALDADMPLIIDESDATIESFLRARDLGYSGVSSKGCKGTYKSLLNAARCARWNARRPARPALLSGEDLTTQPGLALQQDLALAGSIGLTHVERNGHHYVAGFTGQQAGVREARAFLAAHPDLYETGGSDVRVAIRDGRIALRSLATRGFASAVLPDVETMMPMLQPRRTDPALADLN